MSFGKNPHVAKATAAEQKAKAAGDEGSRVSAWREAAHQWERAAEREKFDKRIAEYVKNAEAARQEADGSGAPKEPVAVAKTSPVKPNVLN